MVNVEGKCIDLLSNDEWNESCATIVEKCMHRGINSHATNAIFFDQ